MTWFSVDIEANGPVPGLYSMTSFGAVAVRGDLSDTYYAELKPLPGAGVNEQALAVAGMSMEYLEANGEDPVAEMTKFADWLETTSQDRPVLISDNPGFDASFIAYYFALAGIGNPFGFSSRRIGDLYSGFHKDARKSSEWKSLRTTTHTHNALDDAIGNAGALLKIGESGLRLPQG